MKNLSLYWFLAAIFGIVIIASDRLWGWSSPVELGFLLILTAIATIYVFMKSGSLEPDYLKLARSIETHNPELKATLLTAIEQKPKELGGQLDYLQERVIGEALIHAREHNWVESIPQSRLYLAGISNVAAMILFLFVLAQFKMPVFSFLSPNNPASNVAKKDYEITVIPGDTNEELGTTVVILARFDGKLPDSAKLYAGPNEEDTQEIPFSKNLEDPIFGATISPISSDMVYHVEYDGNKTRNYKITTFQHPALEQADANIVFPVYTKLPSKEIKNTLMLNSVVEGSKVTLTFKLNKPVTTAQLVPKDGDALNLTVDTNNPTIFTTLIEPQESLRYNLKLVDSDGRANKAPPRFVINVVKNLPPNIKLKFPNRDIEASPLEELTLEAEVSDDYGVTAQGVSYILAGSQAKEIPVGEPIDGNKKESIEYVLPMENLQVQPNQLLSYYFWADDIGPDGKTRKTVSDLYFAEVRPFEQIYRENQSFMDQNQQQQQREQQDQNGMQNDQQRQEQLVQLQKQIISATWNIKRQVDTTTNGVATAKDDITLIKDSQEDALEIARNGGDESTGQRGGGSGLTSGAGGRGGQSAGRGGRGGRGGGRGGMTPQSGGMNQISPPSPAAAQSASSDDPMEKAIQHMQNAVDHLQETLSTSTSEELLQALTSEQAAYQELLKLREQESEVGRDRSGQQQNNQNRSARSQQQLQQLQLRQRNDRYETQSQAQNQQQQQQNQQEDLQVLNRLRDLARRQSEMTNRLRETESALREAQNEEQRQQIQRELERLRQEQVQNLRDMDELQQRMDNQQNRERMSDSSQQLSQARERMQQTAEQMQQGQVSEAAANSTRAQSELEQMRDEFQRSTSGQFTQQMQDMRQQARELDEQQQQISQQMRQPQSGSQQGSQQSTRESLQQNPLGQPGSNQQLADRLRQQREDMQNLLDQARQVSEQAEESEPLLSRRLYDTYRQASTANVDRALQTTEELLRRDFAPQAQTSEEQAREGIQNLRQGIEEAARGVLGDEADSLRLARQQLDEAIRQVDPNQTDNMQAREGMQGQRGRDPNNMPGSESFLSSNTRRGMQGGGEPNQAGEMARSGRSGQRGSRGSDPNQAGQMARAGGNRGQRTGAPNGAGSESFLSSGNRNGQRGGQGFDPNQLGEMARGQRNGRGGYDPNQLSEMAQGQRGQRGFDPNQLGEMARGMRSGQGIDPNQLAEIARAMGEGIDPNQIAELLQRMQNGQDFDPNQLTEMARGMRGGEGYDPNQSGEMANGMRGGMRGGQGPNQNQTQNMQARGGGGQFNMRDLENRIQNNPSGRGGYQPFNASNIYDPNNNPLTNENFRQWLDTLRAAEEMLPNQDLREDVATVRERARTIRDDFTRLSKEPQWDMVQMDVVKPLNEVRKRIDEELAKLDSKEAVVPIDRDPVPARYSDLVRAYYENLGGDNK